MAIARQLGQALDDCPRCQALFEIDVELVGDIVVRSDVLVISYQPEGDRLTWPPSLIFEVVSPRTACRDEATKFELYCAAGVACFVLVWPESRICRVYRLTDGEYENRSDFVEGHHRFDLGSRKIDFDFFHLWTRK